MKRSLSLFVYVPCLLVLLAACTPFVRTPPPPAPEFLGIFTPEQLRARVEQTPDTHKIIINEDVAVWFPDFRNSRADWIGAAFIYHFPSMSEVVLNREGRVDFGNTHYESEEAQEQLEAIIHDEALMTRIQEQIAASEP